MFASVNFIFPLTIIFLRFIPVACKDVFSFLVVWGGGFIILWHEFSTISFGNRTGGMDRIQDKMKRGKPGKMLWFLIC